MPRLTLIARDGSASDLDAKTGVSVMEIIRSSGHDEMLALCGGGCSCATCHVYVEGDVEAGPLGADEDDLLDTSEHRTGRSCLSCQIRITEAMDGLKIRIAPED